MYKNSILFLFYFSTIVFTSYTSTEDLIQMNLCYLAIYAHLTEKQLGGSNPESFINWLTDDFIQNSFHLTFWIMSLPSGPTETPVISLMHDTYAWSQIWGLLVTYEFVLSWPSSGSCPSPWCWCSSPTWPWPTWWPSPPGCCHGELFKTKQLYSYQAMIRFMATLNANATLQRIEVVRW